MTNTRFSKLILIYALLYAMAAFFLFWNLSDRLMWGDEAETALLAGNILKFGIPIINDGKNLISQYPEPLEANDSMVWTWNTWLPYYLTAISFRLSWQNTFAARLPFVIIALLAVILMRRTALAYFDDEETALISTLLLIASVPFLLHSRQCRYFSILACGTLWMLLGYNQIIYEGKKRGGLHVALALIVLFYSSFISFVGNGLAIGIHSISVGWKDKKLFRDIAPFYSLVFIVILPWMLYSGMLTKGGSVTFAEIPGSLSFYIYRINFHIFPLVLLLLPPIWMAAKKTPLTELRPSGRTSLIVLVVICQLLLLSVFPFRYFRYLLTILPALILLEANIIKNYVTPSLARYLLVATLSVTNLFGVISLFPFRGEHGIETPIVRFVKEITGTYEDRFENVLTFLKENADESESVALMDPGYPLMFYTNMEVIDARYPRNYDRIGGADWLLTESPSGVIQYSSPMRLDVPESMRRFYKEYKIEVRDTPFGANRPDPDVHSSQTADKFSNFVIYRQLKPGETEEGL